MLTNQSWHQNNRLFPDKSLAHDALKEIKPKGMQAIWRFSMTGHAVIVLIVLIKKFIRDKLDMFKFRKVSKQCCFLAADFSFAGRLWGFPFQSEMKLLSNRTKALCYTFRVVPKTTNIERQKPLFFTKEDRKQTNYCQDLIIYCFFEYTVRCAILTNVARGRSIFMF